MQQQQQTPGRQATALCVHEKPRAAHPRNARSSPRSRRRDRVILPRTRLHIAAPRELNCAARGEGARSRVLEIVHVSQRRRRSDLRLVDKEGNYYSMIVSSLGVGGFTGESYRADVHSLLLMGLGDVCL